MHRRAEGSDFAHVFASDLSDQPLRVGCSCCVFSTPVLQRLGYTSPLERAFHGGLSRGQESTRPSLSSCITGYREHGSTEPRSVAYDSHYSQAPSTSSTGASGSVPCPCSHRGSTSTSARVFLCFPGPGAHRAISIMPIGIWVSGLRKGILVKLWYLLALFLTWALTCPA